MKWTCPKCLEKKNIKNPFDGMKVICKECKNVYRMKIEFIVIHESEF